MWITSKALVMVRSQRCFLLRCLMRPLKGCVGANRLFIRHPPSCPSDFIVLIRSSSWGTSLNSQQGSSQLSFNQRSCYPQLTILVGVQNLHIMCVDVVAISCAHSSSSSSGYPSVGRLLVQFPTKVEWLRNGQYVWHGVNKTRRDREVVPT